MLEVEILLNKDSTASHNLNTFTLQYTDGRIQKYSSSEINEMLDNNEIFITNMRYLGNNHLVSCKNETNPELVSFFSKLDILGINKQAYKYRYIDRKTSILLKAPIIEHTSPLPPVNILGKKLFESRLTLQYIKIPNTINKIEYKAFAYTYNLNKVHIGKGLELIEKEAFSHSGVQEVTIESKHYILCESVFQSAEKLETINGLEYANEIKKYALGHGPKVIKLNNCIVYEQNIPNTKEIHIGNYVIPTGLITVSNDCHIYLKEAEHKDISRYICGNPTYHFI